MSANFMFPPKGFGPGSQVLEGEDEELDYLALPSGMQTFSAKIPHIEDPEIAAPAIKALNDLSNAAGEYLKNKTPIICDFNALSNACKQTISETLGEGEVSVIVEGETRQEAQESVFTGLWRLANENGEVFEIAPYPSIVANAPMRPLPKPPELIEGVVNATALLTEIVDNLENWKVGDEKYVINLTLLPHTPQDLYYLENALGVGGVTILSRGYGNCRIDRCAHSNIWWVRYYNSQDVLILNTIEITEVPDAAIAAYEDIEDTQKRLKDVAEAIS